MSQIKTESFLLKEYFEFGVSHNVSHILHWLFNTQCFLIGSEEPYLLTERLSPYFGGLFALCYLPLGVRSDQEILADLDKVREFKHLLKDKLESPAQVVLHVRAFVHADPSLILESYISLSLAHRTMTSFFSGKKFYRSFMKEAKSKTFQFSPKEEVLCSYTSLLEVLRGFLKPRSLKQGLVLLCLNYFYTPTPVLGYLASLILHQIPPSYEVLEKQIKGAPLSVYLPPNLEFPLATSILFKVQQEVETEDNQAIFNSLL